MVSTPELFHRVGVEFAFPAPLGCLVRADHIPHQMAGRYAHNLNGSLRTKYLGTRARYTVGIGTWAVTGSSQYN